MLEYSTYRTLFVTFYRYPSSWLSSHTSRYSRIFELRRPGGGNRTGTLARPKLTHSAKYFPKRHLRMPIALHEKMRHPNSSVSSLNAYLPETNVPPNHSGISVSSIPIKYSSCEGRSTPRVCLWGFISVTSALCYFSNYFAFRLICFKTCSGCPLLYPILAVYRT